MTARTARVNAASCPVTRRKRQRSDFFHVEIGFRRTAIGTDPVFRHIGPARPGRDAVLGPALSLELPDKNMPGWLARGAANLLDFIWRLTLRRTPPPIDPHTAALLSRNCTLKTGKAQSDLGYEPVITREAGIAALMQAGR